MNVANASVRVARRADGAWGGSPGRDYGEPCRRLLSRGGTSEPPTIDSPRLPPQGVGGASESRVRATGEPSERPGEPPHAPSALRAGLDGRACDGEGGERPTVERVPERDGHAERAQAVHALHLVELHIL